MENWIYVKNLDGETIKVRQNKKYGDLFVDENNNVYKASHLDFTEVSYKFPIDAQEFQMLNNRIEYWRKLRGEIFMILLKRDGEKLTRSDAEILSDTDKFVECLYRQNANFFKYRNV